MTHPECNLFFFSERSLEEVAEIVSAKLLGGIPFIGMEEFIYDEVPAVYAELDVLGLRIILAGYPGEGYQLDMYPRDYPDDFSESSSVNLSQDFAVNISEYIAFLLKDVPEISMKERQ